MYLKEWKYRPSLFEQTRREYQVLSCKVKAVYEKFGAFSLFCQPMPDEQRLYKKRRISSVTEYLPSKVKKEEHVLS